MTGVLRAFERNPVISSAVCVDSIQPEFVGWLSNGPGSAVLMYFKLAPRSLKTERVRRYLWWSPSVGQKIGFP